MRTNFKLLKTLREQGLCQRDLARMTGYHESLISRIVAGGFIPDQVKRVRIARILRVPVKDLFNEEQPHV